MITQRFPLRDVDAAFRLAESNPAEVCKVVIDVGD
jgi:threonine dehydrogenase-like Zn-dependent dehydrogenase